MKRHEQRERPMRDRGWRLSSISLLSTCGCAPRALRTVWRCWRLTMRLKEIRIPTSSPSERQSRVAHAATGRGTVTAEKWSYLP